MQDLHPQTQTFSQARHSTKTREINGTGTPHTFDLEHVALGEALAAAHILPLRHRVGCPAHGAQHRVELARTVIPPESKGLHK